MVLRVNIDKSFRLGLFFFFSEVFFSNVYRTSQRVSNVYLIVVNFKLRINFTLILLYYTKF